MNTDYAALALVVDSSGSMHSSALEVIKSVEQFIGDQKKVGGKASLTVAQFDHHYKVIHDFKDIKEVDEEKFAKAYRTDGNTALLDAIGRTTLEMTDKLNALPESERPKRVVIAIITDGLENASKKFNLDQIKQMIKEKEASGWNFLLRRYTRRHRRGPINGLLPERSARYETTNMKTSFHTISEQITKARLDQEVKFSQEERDRLAS